MNLTQMNILELQELRSEVAAELKRRCGDYPLNALTADGPRQGSSLDPPYLLGVAGKDQAQAFVEYASGAKRSERMPRYDLIVQDLIRRIAERCTGRMKNGAPDGGALKYGEGNWEKGLPTSDVLNHIAHHFGALQNEFRHALSSFARTEMDWNTRMMGVRGHLEQFLEHDDHIGAIGWGLMVLCHQLQDGFHHDPAFEQKTQDRVTKLSPPMDTTFEPRERR